MFKCYNKNDQKWKRNAVIENYNYENFEETELNGVGVNKMLSLL